MSYREAIRVFGTHCCKGNPKNPKVVQTKGDVFSIGCPQAISHLAQVEPATGPRTHDWKTQGKTSMHCWVTLTFACVTESTSVTFLNWPLAPSWGVAERTCEEAEGAIWALTHSSGPPTNLGMSLHKSRSSPVRTASGKVTRAGSNASDPSC